MVPTGSSSFYIIDKIVYGLRYETLLFELFFSAGFCYLSPLTVSLFCVIYNSIAFPDKAKEIKTEKKQQICHILEAELKETFQKQVGSI